MEGKKVSAKTGYLYGFGFSSSGLVWPLFLGLDLLGWGLKTNVWTDITKAISPVSGAY